MLPLIFVLVSFGVKFERGFDYSGYFVSIRFYFIVQLSLRISPANFIHSGICIGF